MSVELRLCGIPPEQKPYILVGKHFEGERELSHDKNQKKSSRSVFIEAFCFPKQMVVKMLTGETTTLDVDPFDTMRYEDCARFLLVQTLCTDTACEKWLSLEIRCLPKLSA